MKLVSFEDKNRIKLGAVIGDQILDLHATSASDYLLGMIEFLEGEHDAFAIASLAIDTAQKAPEESVWAEHARLLPPVPNPKKFLLLAGNYAEHIEEGGEKALSKTETIPRVFMKPPQSTMIANGQPIIIPPNAGFIDWEAELAVIIGKGGKFIDRESAYSHVAGYTIVNDVSERELQVKESRVTRAGDEWFDWFNGKCFDTFAPIGPWLVTRDEIPNPHDLQISLRVNGKTKQNANTGQMIFDIAELIEFISSQMTLEPGDIISTGTPAGVGHPHQKLVPSDIVEVEIEHIGILKNPVQ